MMPGVVSLPARLGPRRARHAHWAWPRAHAGVNINVLADEHASTRCPATPC